MNVVIIGSSGLIGSSVATYLSQKDHRLFLGDITCSNTTLLDKTTYMQVDIMCEESMSNFLRKAVCTLGRIDAFIPLAYPRPDTWGKTLSSLTFESINYHLSCQLGTTLLAMKYIQEIFLKQGNGNIILFSSVQGSHPPKFWHYDDTDMSCPIEYAAAKAAVIAVTKYLAKSFKGKNIRVNCISPGGVFNDQNEHFVDRYKKSCLNKGLLDPTDITGLVEFLISDASLAINGQNIVVDDGWSL